MGIGIELDDDVAAQHSNSRRKWSTSMILTALVLSRLFSAEKLSTRWNSDLLQQAFVSVQGSRLRIDGLISAYVGQIF